MNNPKAGFPGAEGATITATLNDCMMCVCGSLSFLPTVKVFKIKTPIIGKADGAVAKPDGFQCAGCGLIADKMTKTKGEVEKESKLQGGKQLELPLEQ